MFPQIGNDSDETEERILSRRERIQKRNRVLKGESICEVAKDRDESWIAKQIEDSNSVLECLTLEGNELVSSVGVAGTAREVTRRAREAKAAEERAVCLAEERESAEQQLEQIRAHWNAAEGQCDALELHALLQEQKNLCEKLLDQKVTLAERLRKELADRSTEYEETLSQQGNELSLAADRVDQQVASLKEAHLAELALLETVTEQTRAHQVDAGDSRWLQLWETLQTMQRQHDDERERVSENLAHDEDTLHELMAERLHEARAQLQQRTQALGLELQGLRASCCLNAEKMKLNTELLRSRDQEARIMRASQKRRINKLQDKLRALHAEVGERKAAVAKRRKSLRDRVIKLQAECEKSSQFPSVTQTQIKMLVEHGVKQAVTLVKQILTIDEALTTQQLCLPWSPPERLEARLETLALSLIESRTSLGHMNSMSSSSSSEALQQASTILMQPKKVGERGMQKILLQALVDSSVGFLSPEHPGKKIRGVSEQEKMLMELASCLSALGVETEADLISLFNTLRVATTCSACKQKPFTAVIPPDVRCVDHMPYISSDLVLQALKQFTATRAVEADDVTEAKSVTKTPPPAEDPCRPEQAGWEQFVQVLPEHMEDLWDRLHDGLTQHLTVLQDRHEINTQVIKLQDQNAELRRLLQSYAVPKLRKTQKDDQQQKHTDM